MDVVSGSRRKDYLGDYCHTDDFIDLAEMENEENEKGTDRSTKDRAVSHQSKVSMQNYPNSRSL